MNSTIIPAPLPAELWLKIIPHTGGSLALQETCQFFWQHREIFFSSVWSNYEMSARLQKKVVITKHLPGDCKEKVKALYQEIMKMIKTYKIKVEAAKENSLSVERLNYLQSRIEDVVDEDFYVDDMDVYFPDE